MKKIFAIALALVMVLSMASAFAVNVDCETLTFDWTCVTDPTYCGKAVVEVVPYVHVNADCDGDEYVVNNCATAIKGENVYFAIKLSVEALPDADFFDAGYVLLDSEGIDNGWDEKKVGFAGVDKDADEAEVYYYDGRNWVNEEDVDEFNLSTVVFGRKVTKAADAKVCATLESAHNGQGVFVYGDYTIDTTKAAADNGWISVNNGKAGKPGYEWVEYVLADGKIDSITKSSNEFLAKVNEALNLGCAYGVCVNEDNLEAIFGWDFEQESCFDWSTKGASIVDTECVVAIPKTGDASVLAWLF